MHILGGIAAVVLILFFIGVVANVVDPHDTCEDGEKTMAAVMIQRVVEGRLFAPASADFPTIRSRNVRRVATNEYRYASYVDAQNMYGATIRIRFNGVAECLPERQAWRVHSVNLH